MTELTIGDVVAERTVHLTRESLVRYAGASGDFNPIHYRDDVASAVGLPGVLAHGMLTMGLAVQTIVPWLGDVGRILDYGVRFYQLSPQWDHTEQASNFLPDEFNAANAAKLFRPVCLSAYPCDGANRRGMDPRLVAAGVAPTTANTVEGRFIGRLSPDSDRFNGAFQAGQGINPELQDGSAFKISPRIVAGFSLRGLSSVTMARSALAMATLPISGRLPLSRSPPQPNTTTRRFST